LLAEDTEPQISDVHEEHFKELRPGVNNFSASTNCVLKTSQDARSCASQNKLPTRSEKQRVNLMFGDPVGTHVKHQMLSSNNTKSKDMTYRDHCNNNALEGLSVSTKGGLYIPFPEKLFNMLQYIDLQEPELANIVSWQPHGRCFLVHDVPRFESIILRRFFGHNRNSSFLRELNLWNFKRLGKCRGIDCGAYYNDIFLRSKKFLHRNMSRQKQKNKGSIEVRGVGFDDNLQQSSADALDFEPNFYSMTAMPPSAPYYLEAVKSPEGPEAAGALCASSRTSSHFYPCYNNQEAFYYTMEPALPTNYRYQSAVSGEPRRKNILSLEYDAKEATEPVPNCTRTYHSRDRYFEEKAAYYHTPAGVYRYYHCCSKEPAVIDRNTIMMPLGDDAKGPTTGVYRSHTSHVMLPEDDSNGSTTVAAAPLTQTYYHEPHPCDDNQTIAMDYTAATHPCCLQPAAGSTGSRRNNIMSTDDDMKGLTSGAAAPQTRSQCLPSYDDLTKNCYPTGIISSLLKSGRIFQENLTTFIDHHSQQHHHHYSSWHAAVQEQRSLSISHPAPPSPSSIRKEPYQINGAAPILEKEEGHNSSFDDEHEKDCASRLDPLPVDSPPPSLEEWENLIDLATIILE